MTTVRVYLGGGIGPIDIPLPAGVSAPAYGMLSMALNAVATSCPTAGAPVAITAGWSTQGPGPAGVTQNAANGTLTVAVGGIYEIEASLSLSSPNNAGDQWSIFASQNGLSSLLPGIRAVFKINNTTDKVTVSVFGIANLNAGDVLGLAISDATNNGASVVVSDGSFTAMLVAAK